MERIGRLAYMGVFGSVIAFLIYTWALRYVARIAYGRRELYHPIISIQCSVQLDSVGGEGVFEPHAAVRRADRARCPERAFRPPAEEPSRLRPKRAPSSSAQSTSANGCRGGDVPRPPSASAASRALP